MSEIKSQINAIRPSLRRALLFAILASGFISATQFYFKLGSAEILLTAPLTWLGNPHIALGVFFYLWAFYWTMKAHQCGELGLVLPVLSLCDVWNVLLAVFILHEPLTPFRILGTLLILVGVAVVSR